MNYAYGRVSSKDQKLERQFDAFDGCGIAFDHIYADKQSGKDFERKDYNRLLKKIRAGDLLVIQNIDRLGRNYDMILDEWKRITKDIGADILVLDIPLLDTRCKGDSLIGRLISDLVLQLLSFVAENERNNIRQRQAEGIRAAKKRGVKFGRPLTACPPDFPKIVQAYRKKEISCSEAMELSRMKPSTFFYYLKKHLTNFEGQSSSI